MAVFKFFERIFHHMDLMDRMMEVVGINDRLKSLPDAHNVLRRAAARCRSCDNTDECQAFLDGSDGAGETPGFCRNHDLFARLTRQIEADQAAA